MTDHLAGLFKHYSLSANTFYAGTLCENELFNKEKGRGHLHLLRRGYLRVSSPQHKTLVITEPSLLFYPQPTTHQFHIREHEGADLVCATIELGAEEGNPLAAALPVFFNAPFKKFPAIEATSTLLFSEAFNDAYARQPAIERLTEYLLIQLLRGLVNSGHNPPGLLAGLADKRLSKALGSIHNTPQTPWTLDSLASMAGMSRARFATHFREVIGMTPMTYLTRWRVGLTQAMLKRGQPMNLIAYDVGYSSASALSRAFRAHTGLSPREWVKQLPE